MGIFITNSIQSFVHDPYKCFRLKKIEEMFPHYYRHIDMFSMFKSSTTHYYAIRCENVIICSINFLELDIFVTFKHFLLSSLHNSKQFSPLKVIILEIPIKIHDLLTIKDNEDMWWNISSRISRNYKAFVSKRLLYV